MTNAPAPGSPEWQKLMTASKVAAVLGLSPWESPRSLWLKMRGDIPADPGNDATRRGQYLEDGIFQWWRDQHPDARGLLPQFFATNPDEPWAAATLDGYGTDDHGNIIAVEVKSAARDDDWGKPGTDEIPPYYLAQVLWQMWVSGADFAYIAVLFGTRLRFEEYVVQRDDELIAGIVAKCRAFYDSLSQDVPPPLDDSVATYEAMRKLHSDIDPDAAVELPDDLAAYYLSSKWAAEHHEAEHREAKSRLLEAMGNARIATCDGQTIARRQPNKYGVSLVAVAKHITEEDAA